MFITNFFHRWIKCRSCQRVWSERRRPFTPWSKVLLSLWGSVRNNFLIRFLCRTMALHERRSCLLRFLTRRLNSALLRAVHFMNIALTTRCLTVKALHDFKCFAKRVSALWSKFFWRYDGLLECVYSIPLHRGDHVVDHVHMPRGLS